MTDRKLERIAVACIGALAGSAALAGDFDCLIEPRQTIEIRSSVQGLIEKVWVDLGDIVKPGQVLVSLDSGLEEATAELAKFRASMTSPIRSSQSRVDFASQKLSRREKLHEQNYISSSERDEALTEKRLAEAELDEARDNQRLNQLEFKRVSEQLRLRTVKSPVFGVVTERLMHPGELADTGDIRRPILKIADISVLRVEALLPVEAYGQVKAGQMVSVMPELPNAGVQQARVKTVDKVLDAASGTFRVHLEVPNASLRLPAGVKCVASFPEISLSATASPSRRTPSSANATPSRSR